MGVINRRAGDFADADGEHFRQPTFRRTAKTGVRFDAIDHDDRFCFRRVFIHVHRCAVGKMADDFGFHRRADRHAGRGFRNAVGFQHFFLALGGCRAVAAHARKNERFSAEGF